MEELTRRAKIFCKISGIIIGLLSFFWLLIPLLSISIDIFQGNPLFSLFFIFIFLGLAALLIFVAYKAIFTPSIESVQNIVFILALGIFFGMMSGYFYIAEIFFEMDIAVYHHFGIELIAMLIAGGFYYVLLKYTYRWLNLTVSIDWKRREKIAKRFWGLFAFFLYGFLMDLFINIASKKEGFEHVPKYWPIGVIFLVPVILAIVVYKIAVSISLRGRPKNDSPYESHENSNQGQSQITTQ